MTNEPESESDLRPEDSRRLVRFLRRIVALSVHVRQESFLQGGLTALMELQESIFRLQVDVQAEISTAKRGQAKNAASFQYVEELRRVRKLSRKLGDAAAWVILMLDRQVIHSLRDNAAVPIPPKMAENHRAMFEFVQSMISPEWGIPIVHDITDILRVGDVTFVSPTGQKKPLARYMTMELKISPGVPVEDSDGDLREFSVQVHAISRDPMVRPAHVPEKETPQLKEQPQGKRPDRRISRQLERMRTAVDGQAAELHKVSKVGDAQVLMVEPEADPSPQWALLRRAMRDARKNGSASFALGGFVSYTVVYNAERLTAADFQSESMLASLKEIFPHSVPTGRNSLTVQFVSEPSDDDRHPPHVVVPMFLWDVPRRAIEDIVRYRMAVTAVWNMGWLEELIRAEGMEVRPAPAGSDPRDFEVVVPLKWADRSGEYHAGTPWEDVMLAVREFRGPEAVLARLRAARGMTQHVSVADFIEQSDAAAGREGTSGGSDLRL